ncbi:MAG: hypothetical protein KIG81_02590 [Thermoguttaceae bacterium]|nr:hypothetical protein [Thermoguttaceae bacterium]
MTQEKVSCENDDVAKSVDLVNSPNKEKSANASSEKKAKKSNAKNVKSKAAQARDREVGNSLKRLAVVSGLNAPQFMDATDRLSALDIGEMAKLAVNAETEKMEIAKAAPKRRRRPKPATVEEEREENQTFENLALQIVAAPQVKRAKKSSAKCAESVARKAESEPNVCDSAPETEPDACDSAPLDSAPASELNACDSAPNEESNDSDLMDWDFEDSLEVSWGRSTRSDEPAEEDTFPIDMEEEIDNTDDLLDELLACAKQDSVGIEFESGAQEEDAFAQALSEAPSAEGASDVVEECAAEENVDEEKKEEGDAFDDFWGDSESLEISWGRPRQEKKPVKEEKKASEPRVVAQETEPEAQSVAEESVVEAEPEPAKPLTLDDLDFNDADNLAAFFDCGDCDDLVFTPKKAKKEERAESCETSCARCCVAKEEVESTEKREERVPRARRERRVEEPEDRAPRRSRREAEDFEEPVDRAPRRNRREAEGNDEPTDRAPRRREAPEGAVKPVLPTWDDAVGYVVAFNQSRRSMRGRAR